MFVSLKSQRTCEAISVACLHLSHLGLSASRSLNRCPFQWQCPVCNPVIILDFGVTLEYCMWNTFLFLYCMFCNLYCLTYSASYGQFDQIFWSMECIMHVCIFCIQLETFDKHWLCPYFIIPVWRHCGGVWGEYSATVWNRCRQYWYQALL